MTAPDIARPAAFTPSEAALWQAFKASGGDSAREALFQHYLPLARRLAARFHRNDAPNPIEFEELLQLACAGLLESIDRFRPELGVPFRYFSNRRINGSILNGIAKHSEVNEQISFRNRVARERMASLTPDHPPSQDMVATLGLLGEIAAGLALGLMLEETGLYRAEDRDPGPNAYDSLAWKQAITRVGAELQSLPERESTIVRLHYIEGLTFAQIAAVLGLTKGRISQLHKAALGLLRKRLLNHGQFRWEG
jgi:RNA polymerase sigma factor FliA